MFLYPPQPRYTRGKGGYMQKTTVVHSRIRADKKIETLFKLCRLNPGLVVDDGSGSAFIPVHSGIVAWAP
jgi:hypothetical protein